MDIENVSAFMKLLEAHPKLLIVGITFLGIALVGLLFYIIYGLFKNAKGVKIGDLNIDFTKAESVKGDTGIKAEEVNEIKRQIEEKTRYIISRQFTLVKPYLQSLRPIFNRLMYSILNDAMIDSLGIEKETRVPKKKETIKGLENSYYLVEEVKTYQNNPRTRAFTNLVESAVDSLLCDFELEIYKMLVANNIGKCKEDVQAYVKSRSENLIGIIRNNLCDAYNQLSNKNLFDTHKYWEETGITYPEDWISDKVYQLLKECMHLRYSDFE